MLFEAARKIGCDAGIEGIIRAMDDVDLPVHGQGLETVFMRGIRI
jgi:hypothetical protein